jgi:translation initiation factor 1
MAGLDRVDPFADAAAGDEDEVSQGDIHIRLQQRSGKKALTTVEGISADVDTKKLLKALRKTLACNGCVVEHKEYGEVLQFQGDQRYAVCEFLVKCGLWDNGGERAEHGVVVRVRHAEWNAVFCVVVEVTHTRVSITAFGTDNYRIKVLT